MRTSVLCVVAAALLLPGAALADPDKIETARGAGPASVSADATVLDWNMEVLAEGSNGWTCLPDNAGTPGTDPWCMSGPWMNFLKAYMNHTEPTYTEMGIAYMLRGDSPVSNTDPFATGPTPDNHWVEGVGAHLMILLPDHEALKAFPTDHRNGGPWVMWADTPYAHLMVPIDSYPPR